MAMNAIHCHCKAALGTLAHGACWTLQTLRSRSATDGVYWSDTESPMMRQFGKLVEMSCAGPGAQHFDVLANTQPGAPKYCSTQHVALIGHVLLPTLGAVHCFSPGGSSVTRPLPVASAMVASNVVMTMVNLNGMHS